MRARRASLESGRRAGCDTKSTRAIFGGGSAEQTSGVSRVIYAVVGVAGLIAAVMLPRLKAVESRRLTDRPLAG